MNRDEATVTLESAACDSFSSSAHDGGKGLHTMDVTFHLTTSDGKTTPLMDSGKQKFNSLEKNNACSRR